MGRECVIRSERSMEDLDNRFWLIAVTVGGASIKPSQYPPALASPNVFQRHRQHSAMHRPGVMPAGVAALYAWSHPGVMGGFTEPGPGV